LKDAISVAVGRGLRGGGLAHRDLLGDAVGASPTEREGLAWNADDLAARIQR
jgi:hypothetical protein